MAIRQTYTLKHSARIKTKPDFDCRALMNALPTAVYTTDAQGKITFFNKAAADLWGQRPVLHTDQWCGSWRLFWPNGTAMDHDECPMAITLKEGREVRGVEIVAERPDGQRVTVLPYPTLLRDQDGDIVAAINMLVDISERKDTEHRLHLLSGEVNHRANNLLAVVQATIRLTQAPDIKTFRTAVEGRIKALSHAHKMLAKSDWCDIELAEVIRAELIPYCCDNENRAILNGKSVLLPPGSAQSLSVIIHELTTNAAKYGCLTVPGGQLLVNWSVDSERNLSFKWTESGGPIVCPPDRKGFGTNIIDKMTRQLGGMAIFEWKDGGLSLELTVPMRDERSSKHIPTHEMQ